MCLAIFTALDDWTVFVASNRDEDRSRPSLPPQRELRGGVTVLSPRDLLAGGTWIGVNDRGLVALLTNRSDLPTPPSPGRSRGLLVRELLDCRDLASATRRLEAARSCTAPSETRRSVTARADISAPYQLVLASPEGRWAFVQAGDGQLHCVRRDGPERLRELLVVSDRGDLRHAPPPPVVEHARRAWPALLAEERDGWIAARRLLGDTGQREMGQWEMGQDAHAICRTGGPRGTVSATIIGVSTTQVRLDHAPGPPVDTPYATHFLPLHGKAP